jgi:hypothetical protein
MSIVHRACLVSVVLLGVVGIPLVGSAGTVAGRLELPAPPPRPPVAQRGFLDRVENPLAEIRPVNPAPQLAVVLEPVAAGGRPPAPGQVAWELGGESFARPLLVVPVGAEVLITNTSSTPRTLAAQGDPRLIPAGPINPSGQRSFRVTEPRAYAITDRDAPHLRGTLLVVPTPYFAGVDVSPARPSAATFQIADVADGSYRVRVFFRDGWLAVPAETVAVAGKRTTEIAIKIPAGYPLAK